MHTKSLRSSPKTFRTRLVNTPASIKFWPSGIKNETGQSEIGPLKLGVILQPDTDTSSPLKQDSMSRKRASSVARRLIATLILVACRHDLIVIVIHIKPHNEPMPYITFHLVRSIIKPSTILLLNQHFCEV